MSNSLNEMAGENGHIAKVWTALFGIVLWFGSTYAQFLHFHFELSATTQYSNTVVGVGALVSAVVIALALNAPTVFRPARKIRFWYLMSAALVLAIVPLVFLFQELSQLWTCQTSAGLSLVKGETPTPWMLDFLKVNRDACAAFDQFPGNESMLYAAGSSWPRFQLLGGVYILSWAALSALIISVANCFKIKPGP